jgi:chromosome segregation ATPase
MKIKLNAKKLNVWTVLAWLFVVTTLVFAGCSRQIADVKDSQVKLQNVLQAHSQQITANAAGVQSFANAIDGIGQKQTEMQKQIETLQNDNQVMRDQMITMLKQFKDQLSQLSTQINSPGMARK